MEQLDVPRFPADGCYARTHLMVQRLRDRGLARAKKFPRPTRSWYDRTTGKGKGNPDHADRGGF